MGLPAFVEEVPEYDCRDGRVYITLGEVELCMPINVFIIGCIRGREAIERWSAAERGKVIRFRPPAH